MAFSYTAKTGDGTTKSFTFAFEGQDDGYIRETDIVATVDGASVPFTLLSSNTLEFTDAPSNGSEIIIRRVMPKKVPYADFQRGNNFGQAVLNNSFLQLLYVVHEILDGWFPEGFTVREAVDYLEGLRSLSPDPSDPSSVVTFGTGDTRYVNSSGDAMEGQLDMLDNPLLVRLPVLDNEPARKGQLDSEISARLASDNDIYNFIGSEISSVESDYQAADANLQSQLTGTAPLEASAFSPISWHAQTINSSVSIPDNKNAWSFGPTITVEDGATVEVGEGSYWTIADGDQVTLTAENFDEGTL